ncbi:DDE-type integrase/transposase/recombinase [Acinetobacter suaedae]|uniref:DDE-type integrase/transposase/recombinase n=1 Tax=Acinetobacter suaedae TaxID=2609668 RepID=A0A5P1UVG3_9GAMM|nr:Mu transposase C-terminal domain-containing protein [Acinetobacter sp. C16S1]QER40861.1 DDE-type integrase/transposase/recombinase [Acinetobacter sp. C16S1]
MRRILPGCKVHWNEEEWILIDIVDLKKVLLKNLKDKNIELVNALEVSLGDSENRTNLLQDIPNETWLEACKLFDLIRELVKDKKRARTYKDLDDIAEKLGKSRATIYRLIKKLENDFVVSALIKKARKDHGQHRLSQDVEKIIENEISTFYLVPERPTVVELWEQVSLVCREKKIKPPSMTTLRRRLNLLQDRLVVSKRFGSKKAREQFEPIKGSFPGADIPLAVYQIDHTPIDVILVDEEYRKPIGRAFLTIVIDSCTRMIAGFCVSFDPVGALATGIALSHAILPKEMWLAKHEIGSSWPIYGIPRKIYADNAKEFRGTMLERACQEYGIILENRPKGLPNYGGHVERAFGTFMKRSQSLKGTTFSNVKEKESYNSEKKAVLTLKEFESWFATFVLKVYHEKPHNGINKVSPLSLYETFILGDDNTKGIGLPTLIEDETKLKLDFMPFVERTIQEYGVLIDNIYYYADVLRNWIHARDPNNSKLKRKFIFSRDPRDISVVYFFDPELKIYYPIPYRNISHPPISLWELNSIIKDLNQQKCFEINEDTIFEGLKEMRKIAEVAAEKSKSARRMQQRRKDWSKDKQLVQPQPTNPFDNLALNWNNDQILPFLDLEEAE